MMKEDLPDFTAEELQNFKEAFSLFDKNGDGKISTKELAGVVRSLGRNPSEALLKAVSQKYDEDKSGAIEFQEFLHIMHDHLNMKDTIDEITEAFKVFDADGNGFITADELKHAMINFGEKMTDKEVEEMLRRADTDHDGKINYEEFVKMLFS